MNKSNPNFTRCCLSHWRWFAASFALTTLAAVVFLLTAHPLYRRTTHLMVKDEQSPSGLLSSAMGMGFFANMGLNLSSNVDNELEVLFSPSLMMDVVKTLHLDVRYETGTWPFRQECYGQSLPISISFADGMDKEEVQLHLSINEDGTITLSKMKRNREPMDGEASMQLNKPCKTALGLIVVTPSPYFQTIMKQQQTMDIDIHKLPRYEAADKCLKKMKGEIINNNTSIIELSYDDTHSDRAEQILTCLTDVYEREWRNDKEAEKEASNGFIDQRINEIAQQLAALDGKVAHYEQKSGLADQRDVMKAKVESATGLNEMVVKLNNERYVLAHMRKLMDSKGHKPQVLPANVLPDNENISTMIANYNAMVLKRQSLADNSSERNPLVSDLDMQIAPMRQAISHALDNAMAQTTIRLNGLSSKEQQLNKQLSSTPSEISRMLPTKRQHEVIEALYVFLLQKREENSISHLFTGRNIRVVTPPVGKRTPIFPRKLWTLAAAWLLALLLPTIVLYLRSLNEEEKK